MMRKTLLVGLVLLLVFVGVAAMATSGYSTTFIYGLKINATGNINLTADGYLPEPKTPGELFPAIIFPNSWSTPEIEYIVMAKHFASKGYVTLEYQTRGWFLSGGYIDTAGPLDRDDTRTLFDYVCSHAEEWHVNTSRIAFAGISYGAGLSLMAIGHNPLLRTAVALSGWDLFDNGFYYNKSPAEDQLRGLLHAGEKVGRIQDSLKTFFHDMVTHQNMSAVHAYANLRSPESLYLDTFNRNRSPIFLSNNLNDRLFFPQTKPHFWNRIQGPKFLLLNQGSHAEPEALGLLGIPGNYIWGKVEQWLEYWLKDVDNGILNEPPIQVQSGDSIFAQNYTKFTAWPDPEKSNPLTLFFTPRGNQLFGGLSETSAAGGSDSIGYDANPQLNEGPSDKQASFGDLPTFDFATLAPTNTSIVYVAAPFQSATQLCGSPSANLTLTVPSSGNWQIYAYFYQVNGTVGTLLGDGLFTHWADESEGRVPEETTINYNIEHLLMRTVCHVFPSGTSFGVAFVLRHQWYTPASTDPNLVVGFTYSEMTTVTLPRITRH